MAQETPNIESVQKKIGIPFLMVIAGFLLLPVGTYLYLRPAPQVGGFNALDAARAQERILLRDQVELQALEDLGLNPGSEYGWVDKSVGTVRIPITQAMKMTVAKLANSTPQPSDFVDAVTALALGITPDESVLAPPRPQEATQQPAAQNQASEPKATSTEATNTDPAVPDAQPQPSLP